MVAPLTVFWKYNTIYQLEHILYYRKYNFRHTMGLWNWSWLTKNFIIGDIVADGWTMIHSNISWISLKYLPQQLFLAGYSRSKLLDNRTTLTGLLALHRWGNSAATGDMSTARFCSPDKSVWYRCWVVNL